MKVSRHSASCSQYQSEESCVRLRKRAALARSTCSAVRARAAPRAALPLPRVMAFRAPAARLRRVAMDFPLPRQEIYWSFTPSSSPACGRTSRKVSDRVRIRIRDSSPGAFAGEKVKAAGHDDGGAGPDGTRGDVAEHQVAENRHVDHLLVEEGRQNGRGRIAMPEGEQIVAKPAQHAE